MLSSAQCGATLLTVVGLAALVLPAPSRAADPIPRTDVGLFVRSGGEWIAGADPSPVLGDVLVSIDAASHDADGPRVRARVEGHLAPGVLLREAHLTGVFHQSLQVSAGEMVLPMLRSARISPKETRFFERPLLTRLMPERGIGARLAGSAIDDRIEYVFGVFGPSSTDEPDDPIRFGGRVGGRLPLGDGVEIDAELGGMTRDAHGRREAQRQLFAGAGVRWSPVAIRWEIVDARFDSVGAVGIEGLGTQLTAEVALPWEMMLAARWGRTTEGAVADAQFTTGLTWQPWDAAGLALEYIQPIEGTLPAALRLYGRLAY